MYVPIFGTQVRVTPRDLAGVIVFGLGLVVITLLLALLSAP
jgi:hypothetical protein